MCVCVCVRRHCKVNVSVTNIEMLSSELFGNRNLCNFRLLTVHFMKLPVSQARA